VIFERTVKCPYCEHEDRLSICVEDISTKKEVYTCDVDDGGCDRDFVIYASPNLHIQIGEIVQQKEKEEKRRKTDGGE
jgi:hypothetical protein